MLPTEHSSPEVIAQLAAEEFIRSHAILEPPAGPVGILAERAATFVTIKNRSGALRGCIGTVEPRFPTVVEEIIHNAIGAASQDPRFPAVAPWEIPNLVYGVDVLSVLESARGVEDLSPQEYGVIIECKQADLRAVLLPGIEGIDSPDQQWQAVHIKAGILLGTPVEVKRFTVRRFGKK